MRRFVLFLIFGLAASIELPGQIQYEPTNYPFTEVSGVAIADFDRDGWPDIAVPSSTGITLSRNAGNGHFEAGVFYAVPAAGGALALDVNGDGWPDIVNWNPYPIPPAEQRFSVLLNNKDGTFRNGAQFTTSEAVSYVAAADFNNDGRVDLLVEESGRFQTFLGTGTGTFTAGPVTSAAGISPFGLSGDPHVEDFNGDGKQDIAAIVGNTVQIWYGNGDGAFRKGTSIPSPTTLPVVSIATGDFNNDGIPDLAMSGIQGCPTDPNHLCGTNRIYVYLNDGRGGMRQIPSFFTLGLAGGQLYAEDLNGDQNVDLIMVSGDINVGAFDYAPGKGNGSFGPDVGLYELDSPFVVFRDLNLDSRHDFLFPDAIVNEVAVFLAKTGYTNCAPPGSGTLAAKVCTPVNNAVTDPSVLVAGSGNSPLGVKRMEIWIDGIKRFQRFEDQIAQRFTLKPGAHRIGVVAVDQYLGYSTTVRTITVR